MRTHLSPPRQQEKSAWSLMISHQRIFFVFFVFMVCVSFLTTEISFASEPAHIENKAKISLKIQEAQKLLADHHYSEAEKAFKQVLASTSPADNKMVIDLLNYIGATLHAQKKETEAIAVFNKALIALPNKLPDGDIRKGKILSNLSLAYSAQGQTSKAMECSEKALSIFHAHKAGASDLGLLLNSYGRLKMDAGDFKRAETLFAESVAVRETCAGKNSITLVLPLMNLSGAYLQERKFTQAESTCRRAIIICQQQDGKESEMLFPLLCSLGSLQVEQNRHAEAISSYKRAKEIAERYFGRNSEEALITCFSLSEFSENDGQTKQAEEYLSRAVEISRLLYGTKSKKNIEATLALAQLLQLHGNTSEAERLRLLCRLSHGK